MAEKACWHSPAKQQLVLDVSSEQAVIHRLCLSRGEEGTTPTLSQPLGHPTRLFQAAHPCPLPWDVCSPTHLSSQSHRTLPAPGKASPPLAQLPTTSTCLEQHPEKPWRAQTWLCCRKSRNKQTLLTTIEIRAMTTTTNNRKKKFLPNFSFWS